MGNKQKDKVSLLIEAAQEGDISKVKSLLDQGVDVNSKDEKGRLTIHLAKTYEVVELLVQRGANVFAKDIEGRTPLHNSCEIGSIKEVKLFLNEGVDINAVNIYGETPFYYALFNGYIKLAELLIKRGADVKIRDKENRDTLLHIAASKTKNNIKIIKMLLKRGANINAVNKGGRTPLYYAVWKGFRKNAKFLIKRGADVNIANVNNVTPLHLACIKTRWYEYHYNRKMIKVLLRKKVNINTANKSGQTPLYYALWDGLWVEAKLLIKKGADVLTIDEKGNTLLHIACKNKGDYGINIRIMKKLLKRGVDINALNNDGDTPLHIANQKKNYKAHLFLVKQGADTKILNKAGEEPCLHFRYEISKIPYHKICKAFWKAVIDGNFKKFEAYLQKGINLNTGIGKRGLPLLDAMAVEHNIFMVKYLISKGAKPDKSKRASSLHLLLEEPMELMLSKNDVGDYYDPRIEIAEILIKAGADLKEPEPYYGRTPLHQAAYLGLDEIVECLIKHGADVHVKAKKGYTPLHEAVKKRISFVIDTEKYDFEKATEYFAKKSNAYQKIILALLNAGALINAQNAMGETPLFMAVSYKLAEAVKLLIKHNADLNILNDKGETPLLKASRKGYLEFVELLIDSGADIHCRDKDGNTPLHLAASKGKIKVVKSLVEKGADYTLQNKANDKPLDLAISYGVNTKTIQFLKSLGENRGEPD